VVHVIHQGEKIGEGYNLSEERIIDQIKTLNEDFRRKVGTRGFNNHPNGADTRIEFVLAKSTPNGTPTNGIVRIDSSTINNPIPINQRYDHFAYYSYWDYKHYLNIWIDPLPETFIDVILGFATGPNSDLPGNHLFALGEPIQAEGIIINSFHFGKSAIQSNYNLGRTLTHEVGHYLGLLHLWGSYDCATNDYCEDTPPVSNHNSGCPTNIPLACNGEPAFIANYMDYTADDCMNMFTKDQVKRMHYVLENTSARKSLIHSPGLKEP
tara:strand:+ start:54655 stop:55455 length:801 start_codon:yes stop_codon:yes gene_type:complete